MRFQTELLKAHAPSEARSFASVAAILPQKTLHPRPLRGQHITACKVPLLDQAAQRRANRAAGAAQLWFAPADSSAAQIPGKNAVEERNSVVAEGKVPGKYLVHHVMTVATLRGRTIVSRMLKEWLRVTTASDRRCNLQPR
jgi:hypothetical protein